MRPWVVPDLHWLEAADAATIEGRLEAEGEVLVTWPPTPFEQTPTHCYRVGDDYWVWQPEVGGVRFRTAEPELFLYPLAGTDRSWFEHLVARSWLPAIYPIWQRQVLHASAVARRATGDVIAFSGPSGAGKSTTAYGMAQRPGWTLVADDTLAFSCSDAASAPDAITLYPLRREARLRPATAEYFGMDDATEVPFEWPAAPLRLRALYVLEGRDAPDAPTAFTRLGTAESYTFVLGQAHAMTLKLPDHNQRLMRDYLTLAARVPAFRLAYPKSFDRLAGVFAAVEAHAREHGVE